MRTTEPGNGELRFPGGERIHYTFEFHYVATEGLNILRGQQSGTAFGRGTFLTPRTPPDVTEQCAGEGAEWVPMDFSFTTVAPLVSKQGGGRY